MLRSFVALGICFSLFLGACEKPFIKKDVNKKPVANFNKLWHQANKRYAFFKYKQIDWDSIRSVYRPRIDNDMSQEALFDQLKAMLASLEDGHVGLESDFDQWRYSFELSAKPNFNRDLIERHYEDSTARKSGPFLNIMIDSIGYIYYPSFANNFETKNLNYVIRRFQGLKGIIFDVRNNTGGSIRLVEKILARFIQKERIYGYLKEKTGSGHDDFSEPKVNKVSPADSLRFNGKMVVLTNRKCYSSANVFASAIKTFPRAYIMGDTTGGGGGQPYTGKLPNGWRYRLSINQLLNKQKAQTEDGVTPDIYQTMTIGDDKKDEMIERAVRFLK